MQDATATQQVQEQIRQDGPSCVGCQQWKSVGLLKTGCPSCFVVGLLLLPLSLVGWLIGKVRGRDKD